MKAILFDLDGTLLPMDVQEFMALYGKAVTQAFIDFEEASAIFPQILKSLEAILFSKEADTNYNKFFNHFEEHMPQEKEVYINRFNKFYEDGFETVKAATASSSDMIKAVEILKSKGYKLIIATNPIFPMEANKSRIRWAGLDINHFDHVTSFEKNTSCKPHLEFYQEVLKENGLRAEEVLMVGNDVQEDLIIKALGASTYLINDHLINRKPNEDINTDYCGSYKDFLSFVENL